MASRFRCANGICIEAHKKCDGRVDCSDGTDEAKQLCTKPTEKPFCKNGLFDCLDNRTCINNTKRCNKKIDCPNGADEKACKCSDKKLNSCSQICVDLAKGYKCSCRKGYSLQRDGKTCVDVNECDTFALNMCTQKCMNTNGAFKCECEHGFTWEHKSQTCKLDGEFGPSKLIFPSRETIRTASLDNGLYDVLQQDGRNYAAVDYLQSDKTYFWIDTQPAEIRKGTLHIPGISTLFSNEDLTRPVSLAVDWIGKNVYVIDAGRNSLSVISMNNKAKKTLVVFRQDHPMALALYPQHGVMFCTVIKRQPSILRIGMNGLGSEKIITDDIKEPKGIAVDFMSKRIYWSDSHLHRLESSNLQGKERKILINKLKSPFGIAVFGDDVFWSDVQLTTINKAHKISGTAREVIKRDIDAVHSLKVRFWYI